MIKKSLKLHGHKTSVSLEEEFWFALQKISCAQNKPVSKIIEDIDDQRTIDDKSSLTSKVRIYVIKYFININN